MIKGTWVNKDGIEVDFEYKRVMDRGGFKKAVGVPFFISDQGVITLSRGFNNEKEAKEFDERIKKFELGG